MRNRNRKRLQFVQTTLRASDMKVREGSFVSNRKAQRMAAEIMGTLSASTETPADWSANTGFLMGLLVALTTRARLGVINQDPTLKSAVVPQGVVELIHYVSENLQWRLANRNRRRRGLLMTASRTTSRRRSSTACRISWTMPWGWLASETARISSQPSPCPIPENARGFGCAGAARLWSLHRIFAWREEVGTRCSNGYDAAGQGQQDSGRS